MPTYTAQQLQVIRNIRRIGQRRGEPTKEIIAALTTGRVESNFTNPHGGDADSQGWRQERKSLYPNPTNLRASINRFYNEANKLDRGQSAAELAADVQRPAAQYRGRYAQHLAEARQLLGGGSSQGYSLTARGGSIQRGIRPSITPGGENIDKRGALLAALLDNRKKMPLLDRFNEAVSSGAYTSTTPTKVNAGTGDRFVPGKQITVSSGQSGQPRGYDLGRVTVAPNANRPGQPIHTDVVRFVRRVAGRVGAPLTIGTGTNHSRLTINGTVSDHASGNAADVPLTGKALIHAGQQALIAAGMPRAQALKQTGGGFNVGGWQIIFNTDAPGWGDHTTHLHIGRRH